jgi:uncharacterized protein YndB with AHSA1/START domain
MTKLFVEKSIDISAPASTVWIVLTSPRFTEQWSGFFGAKGPIETDWRPGSRVLWKNAQREVYVSGAVVDSETNKLLRFTVRDTKREMQPASGLDEDDIAQTYALVEDQGHTTLSIAHGDFSKLFHGDKILPSASAVWDRVLSKIKDLAESLRSGANSPNNQ